MEDDTDRFEMSESEFISIHVPRVEDDLLCAVVHILPLLFQSTSPVWRTTGWGRRSGQVCCISIHVPRVEDDRKSRKRYSKRSNFNPRPPCGGRRFQQAKIMRFSSYFNPRPPCGGRPNHALNSGQSTFISIHVPRVEDDV